VRLRLWRVLAGAGTLVLVLRGLWGLGLMSALAARLEPEQTPAPVTLAPAPEPEPERTPEPELTPAPTQTPPPVPEPEETASPAMAPAADKLPRVEDRTGGHDLLALLEEGWSLTLPEEGPQILILHSHSTEAYAPEGEDVYEASDPGRTTDKGQNVIRVGDELARVLEEAGFAVLHDTALYDYPSYNGAYSRSRAAAEDWLEQYPGIRVVIDLHRDALGGAKTRCSLPEGEDCAQVMLVLTTGESGLYHPNWRENVKLGLELQAEMEETVPGLARPLLLSPARYNEQLSPGYLLLEVGSDANTLREALEAARRFGACAAEVLLRHLTNPQG